MKTLLLALLFAAVARPAFAQDVRSMDTWMMPQVVHYKIVAEMTGGASVGAEGQVGGRAFKVTDRWEIEFDWNELAEKGTKLKARPVIRNFPTQAAIEEVAGCPASKVDGTVEYATVTFLKETFVDIGEGPMSMGFTLELKQDLPAVAWAYAGEGPCTAWSKAAARSSTSTIDLQFTPMMGMALAMGKAGEGNITADGKSIRGEKNGWVLTITPTPVK